MDVSRRYKSSQDDVSKNKTKDESVKFTRKPTSSDDDFEHIEHVQPNLQELLNLLTTKIPELAEKAKNEFDDTFAAGSNRNEKRTLEREYKELQRQNGKLEKEKLETEKKCQDEVYKLQQKLDEQKREIDKLLNAKSQEQKLAEKYEQILQSYNKLELKLKETEDKLRLTEAELDDTKTRLSKSMGNKLTDNNPNIADLSDKNRPTKLAERFKELYDNQWTEAYEYLDGTGKYVEEKNITVLLTLLMDTMSFCERVAKKQFTEIQEATAQTYTIPSEMSDDVNKNIKDFRRSIAAFSGKQIYKKYQKELQESYTSTAITAKLLPNYVEECFNVCWFMQVCDPPVVFGPNSLAGETFNKDMYTAYTKSGNKVAFVVWPALQLHKNGPVLTKGIAQGYDNTRRPTSAPQKSRIKANFQNGTQQNEASTSTGYRHEKQDSYSQTTVATKKAPSCYIPPQEKPPVHDIENFLRWRGMFGDKTTRELLGAERYDKTRSYCLLEGLIVRIGSERSKDQISGH